MGPPLCLLVISGVAFYYIRAFLGIKNFPLPVPSTHACVCFGAEQFAILASATIVELATLKVVISMRFNVICSYSPSEQERKYNEVAERIAKNELDRLGPALQGLRSIYPDDDVFRAAFSEKIIDTMDSRNNRVVRFILCALERHLSGQDHSFFSDAFNVEHVLPQNAPDGWGGFDCDDANALIYRLGNMVLLRAGDNRGLGASDYVQKRAVYQQSEFAVTKRLAEENAAWGPEKIAAQQTWMAKQATTVWRIAQLS